MGMGAPLLPALLLAACWVSAQAPRPEDAPRPSDPQREIKAVESRVESAPPPSTAAPSREKPPAERVVKDLSSKFFPECRAQGDTSSCHAFATIAPLEAAMLEPVRLSAADILVRVALSEGRYELVELDDGTLSVEFDEGGSPGKNFAVAIEKGVAETEVAPWDKFLAAYGKFRDEQRARCRELIAVDDGKAKKCRRDEKKILREFLDGLKGKEGQEKREKLLGDPEALATSREKILPKLKGLVPHFKDRNSGDFDKASAQDAGDKDICREKGRKQTAAIIGLLDANTPATICFNMENLPGWDKDMKKKSGGKHCLVLDGYSVRGEGAAERKIFSTRNSWGGYIVYEPVHPSLPDVKIPRVVPFTHELGEEQACAINVVYWLTRGG